VTPLLVLFALAQGPQRDVRTAPAAATGTIKGVVTTADAQARPLRRVRVTLSGPSLQLPRAVVTGDEGTFVFERVPLGRYTVTGSKDGYVSMNYGAARPGRPGTSLPLAASQTIDLALRLPRGAVIAGTITDVDGLPAAGVQVVALMSRFVGGAGERRLVPAPVAYRSLTDDRGIYRIYGLAAGEYTISAQSQQRAVGLGVPEVRTFTDGRVGAQPLTSAVVFYPGTTDLAQARRFTLAAGEERAGVDLQMQYVPLATVSGVVPVTANGPPPFVTMSRLGDIAGFEQTRDARVEADGRFVFVSIPPGSYLLIARALPPATGNGPPPAGASSQWFTAPVVVEGQDVTVALSPQPTLSISGRLEFAGSHPAPDVSGLLLPSLNATQTIGTYMLPLPPVQMEAGGRFTVSGILPGSYRVGVFANRGLPGIRTPIGPWWLKSLIVNGRDILDAPLDLREGTDAAVATFSDEASQVSGTVRDASGAAAPDAAVVIFTTDRRGWFFNSRRVVGLRTDRNGRYEARNLPPGEYRILATPDLEQGEWFDPSTLDRLLADAGSITVTGVEQQSRDLVIRHQP
jgi:carboxypeptidase family protein